MALLRVLLAVLISVVALLVVTFCYVLVRTRGAQGPRGGAVGIDVALLPRMTVFSPMYWLVVVVVLGILWWFLWGWLFGSHIHRLIR